MARRILQNISKSFAKPNAPEATTYATHELYAPLREDKPDIRLLHLHAGSWDDDIETSLRQHYLLEVLNQYVAISYTWGRADVDRPVLIRCNGKPVFVSSNLFTVLRRIRKPDRVVKIWADALCIDQGNSLERTQQVGLMADIYSCSRQTVIWLGEPTGSEDMGTRFKYVRPRLNLSLREASPQIMWNGDRSDYSLREAYLLDGGSSIPIEGRVTPDIFGAFCLVHELAEGVPNTNLQTLDQPSNMETNYFGSRKAPAVWAGLARLMSRAWVRVQFVCSPSELTFGSGREFG
jgi:hypothetical protein